ncbi:MAG: right-handed parallel beta-helix repeat-containing protein [Desulfobacterales bacterium]
MHAFTHKLRIPATLKSLATFLLFGLLLSSSVESKNFYVSPLGDDANSGTKEQPFKTLERAQEAVRKAVTGGLESHITVWMTEGTYRISEPLRFDSGDSGSEIHQVFYKAMPGARPVISGGMPVDNWSRTDDGLWAARVHPNIENFRELYIGDKRCTRARHPNEGYFRVAKVGEDRRTNFYFNEGDFPRPEDEKNVELVLLHDWSISRIGVKDINWQTNNLRAVDSIGAKSPSFFNLDHWEEHPRYYLAGSKSFLDANYEWYFDEANNRIYLQLPEGRNPNHLKTTVPVSEGLMRFDGKASDPITNLTFEGITFQYSRWNIPEMGYCGVQATHYDPRPKTQEGWTVVPAAVKGKWVEDFLFKNCRFQNLGTSGLWLATGSKNCTVQNSVFMHIAGNGIMIGEGRDRQDNGQAWWKARPDQAADGNTIRNCTIEKCGREYYGAVGIWAGLVANTTIENNEVAWHPYTGISIGWMWNPQETPCEANVIKGNHIHHVMQILSDGGGIYMLGLQPDSRLVNNHIHDVPLNAGRAESNGMFLDQGATDLLIANNLIYNIAKSPLRFHQATTNLVRDNYLFCTGESPPIQYNNTDPEDINKKNNHVFREGESDYQEELERLIEKWKKKK